VPINQLLPTFSTRSEGFVEEGVLRECLRTESGYDSPVVMSILRSEFERLAAP
jgi:diamine N-acetyltransferase